MNQANTCPICGHIIKPVPYINVTDPCKPVICLFHDDISSDCPANVTPPIKDIAFNVDCLYGMDLVPSKSVDLILCDLPYGTTRNKWDVVLPFNNLWEQYERIIKDDGAIILFSNGLFTSRLIASNEKLWRYNLVWDKGHGTDFLNANVKPLSCHEDIAVFYKRKPKYNKQFWYGKPYSVKSGRQSTNYDGYDSVVTESEDGRRNPLTILRFSRDTEKLHPTQKPVALLEYLIRTYTDEGDTVLDNCFGSGSTLIAALNCNRVCIGFEKDESYFSVTADRLTKRKAVENYE